MSGFRTQREQSKWDLLQSAASAPIDKMLAGVATPADIKALSSLLAQQHELAGKIFDSGVSDAEKTADTIIDRLNSDRVATGKNPISAKAHDRIFRRTFAKVLSSAIEDIIGTIKDELDGNLGERQRVIDSAFDRIRRFTQNPQPTADQSVSRQPSILDRLRRLTPPSPASSGSSGGSSVWNRFRRLAHPGEGEGEGSPSRSFTQTVVATASKAKSALSDMIARIKRPRDTDDNDEDKKANTWLRKLKALMGSGLGKLRDKAGSASGIISQLAKGLLLTLMSPKLIETITDQIQKYLNFDTISNFVASTWKNIKEGGTEALNWIVDKVKAFFKGDVGKAVPTTKAAISEINASVAKNSAIPSNTTVESAKRTIPELEKKIETTKLILSRVEKRAQQDPSDDNKVALSHTKQRLAILENQLAQYKAKASGKPAPALVMPNIGTPGTSSKAVPASSPAGSTPGSVTLPVPSTKSQVVPQVKPTYKDGIILDKPGAQQQATKDSTSAKNTASTPVSLASFGYNSGDDTLNLLNLGVIA